MGNSSVIVLGVHPRYRVQVFEGDNDGDKWLRNPMMTTLNVHPEDGYIVAKVRPRSGGKNYGVGGILPEGIGGDLFFPCAGRKTVTFEAPEGKVVYVGNINYERNGKGVSFEVSSDISAARAHLQQKYPLLAEKLVNGGFSVKELSNTSCTTTLVVPIFIR
jgi:hypothetical protein